MVGDCWPLSARCGEGLFIEFLISTPSGGRCIILADVRVTAWDQPA